MDPVEQTTILLTDLSEYIGEILGLHKKDGSQERKDISDSAEMCFNLCERGARFAGQVDIRGLTDEGMEKTFDNFLGLATQFDLTHGEKAKFPVKLLGSKIKQLSSLLKMNWNSGLEMPTEDQMKADDPFRNFGMCGPDPMGLSNMFRGLQAPTLPPDSSSGHKSPVPVSANSKPVLKKVTPVKDKASYSCEFCDNKYSNFASYKKHNRDKHDKEVKEGPKKVTCMIEVKEKGGEASRRCNAKQPLAKMYRHLASHNITRDKNNPGEETFLRFFKSPDGGEFQEEVKFTEAVFLPLSAPDPSSDEVEYYESLLPRQLQNSNKKDNVNIGIGKESEESEPSESAVDKENLGADNNDNIESDGSRPTAPIDPQPSPASSDFHGFSPQEDDGPIFRFSKPDDDDKVRDEVPNELFMLTDRNVNVTVRTIDKNCNVDRIKDMAADVDDDEEDEDVHDNSNVEVGDDAFFKAILEMNREKRYQERNSPPEKVDEPWESEKNKAFIEEFLNYLKTVKYAGNPNKDTSTINKTINQMFKFKNSWLNHVLENDNTFSLDRLLMFSSSSDLVQLKDPTPWIYSILEADGSVNASDRKENLKSWARMRDFIFHKIGNYAFDLETELMRGEVLQNNLKKIDESLKRHKVWTNLENQIKSDKRNKTTALAIANPSDNKNEVVSVKVWYESQKFKELHEKHQGVWRDVIVSKKDLKPADLVEFAHTTRFHVMLEDKNRSASYCFSNQELICGAKLWYPEDFKSDQYVPLPEDWDCHLELPRKHDALQISLGGNRPGMKNQTGTTVTISGIALDLVEKYRDLKEVAFKSRPEMISPKQPFFVNYEGAEIDKLKNTSGSLLDVFSKVVGVKHATVTSIRRGLDNFLINSNVSRKRVKIAGGHSEAVQLEYYDRQGADARSEITYQASQHEAASVDVGDEELSDEMASKRARRDEEDSQVRSQFVNEILSKSKKSRTTIGKNMKILPEDKRVLQELLSSDKYHHLHAIRKDVPFPGPKPWKKMFYRLVDSNSLSDEDQQTIRQIERRVFDACKEDIVKESEDKNWSGSDDQNRRADVVISTKIRTSFRVYEKSSALPKESYFYFK